jgi:hypothetical protein
MNGNTLIIVILVGDLLVSSLAEASHLEHTHESTYPTEPVSVIVMGLSGSFTETLVPYTTTGSWCPLGV